MKKFLVIFMAFILLFSSVGMNVAAVDRDGEKEGPVRGTVEAADSETESINKLNNLVDLEVSLAWVEVPAGVIVPNVDLQLVKAKSGETPQNYENVGEVVTLPPGTISHTYSVDPGSLPAYSYDIRLINASTITKDYDFKIVGDDQGFKITLTYAVKTKIDLLGEIVWTGGKPFDGNGFVKPSPAMMQLYRDGSPRTSVTIPQADMIETETGWEADNLFKDLDRFAPDGHEYDYTIGTGAWVAYTKVESGMKITLDLKPVIKIITVKKIWRGVPTKPSPAIINLNLRASNTTRTTVPITFDNPTPAAPINGVDIWTETQTVQVNIALYSSFSATAKEVASAEYRTLAPAGNWVNGFVFTNTYRTPVTATKVWEGGPELKPSVTFQLWRKAGPAGTEVRVMPNKTLEPGATQATWTGFGSEVTDDAGVPYIYWVKETSVHKNYTKEEDGLTVTNTYASPTTGTFTATKVWEGGTAIDRPEVQFQLYRNIEDQDPVAYREPETLVGSEHTWSNLELTDGEGNDYIYSFLELEVENYDVSYEGNTVTNTYVSPTTGTFTATKVWEGGTKPLSAVRFQLYRNIEGGVKEAVGSPVSLTGLTYKWENLVETDGNGVAYEYSFEESTVPANYEVTYSEDGLTAINTYNIPITPVLTLEKLVEEDSFSQVGDKLHYSFTVKNEGTVPVVKLIVNDPLLGIVNLEINLTLTPLAVGETYTHVFSAPYIVTEADVAANGPITNVLTVIGETEEGFTAEFEDDVTIPFEQVASFIPPILTLEKLVEEDSFSQVGDELHYSFTVKNEGTVPVVKIIVNDLLLGVVNLEIDLTLTPLAVGETYTHVFSAPYIVAEADVSANAPITNVLTVIAETEEGFTAEFEDDVTVPFEQVASFIPPILTLEKLVEEDSFSQVGDKLHYSFTVKNEGIVPVVKLIVNDPKLGIENLILDLTDDPLMPGDTYSYTFSQAYVISAADVEAGKVENELTVIGETPEGARIELKDKVTVPMEKVLAHMPKTGERYSYRAGLAAVILGGAIVIMLIKRRQQLKQD